MRLKECKLTSRPFDEQLTKVHKSLFLETNE